MSKDKDVLIQIGEIRRQLWLGHASLMVGCGFSRNADKATPTTPLPPDWKQLSVAFASRLYSSYEKTYKDEIIQRKNVLQLAQEFDIAFQRPALNTLLKELIQDDNLLPSPLYGKMLELPWVDIFTTNYDTLLERASRSVINKKYDVVYACHDLPYSESPRIIKLHGSFPTEATHLIVSEEDYRTYPDKYSPFVNTVQQAIMESALCLVGFSGTDPNFLKWIGWVKDNLKSSMPPIYLIGLFNSPVTERKVLEDKNIITIDLSDLDGIEVNDHNGALNKFFTILNERPAYVDWTPSYSSTCWSPKKDATDDDIIKVITNWECERKSYPNWLVLPWHKRSTLVSVTEQWTNSLEYLKKLPSPWDLKGLFELNWRMEKCLMPIWNNLIPEYEAILQKYDPFSISEKAESICKDEAFKFLWRDLCFSLLRWSREELDSERWSQYENVLTKITSNDINSQNRLYYEQATHAMAIPCLEQLDKILEQWDKVEHPFEWNMKYASVLAEIGQTDKTISLLTATLNELRPYIPRGRIKNDYYLLSLEGDILVSLCMVEQHKKLGISDSPANNQHEAFRCRLKELEQYDCNPWDNLDKFLLTLSAPEKIEPPERKVRNFSGITTTTFYRNGWPIEPTRAFQLLRFFEETGIPSRLGMVNIANKALAGAIARIANCSPGWAFFIFNKIGKIEDVSCELFYSQEKLYHIGAEKINQLVEIYIVQLEYIITQRKQHLSRLNNDFYTRLAKNLFEAISRLTVKASSESLQKIFDLGITIYNSDITNKGLLFDEMGFHYFGRLLDAMSPENIFKNLNALLSIKIPDTRSDMFWQNPVHIDWRGYKSSYAACSPELTETINRLAQQLDTDDVQTRSNVLLYLNACWHVNILSVSQKRLIANNLVKHAQPGDLPADNNFYKFAYKEFLSPLRRKYDINQALKNYYTNFDFKFFSEIDGKISLSLGRESDIGKFSHSVIPTSSVFRKKASSYIDLQPEECWIIFEHFRTAWSEAEHIIGKKMRSDNWTDREFKSCIEDCLWECDKILGEVVIPRIINVVHLDEIKILVNDIDTIVSLPSSRIALAAHKKKYPDELIYDILTALGQADERIFRKFSHAFYNAYRFARKKQLPFPPPHVFYVLLNAIGMKSDATFKSACYCLGKIVEYFTLSAEEEKLLMRYMMPLDDDTSFLSLSTRFSRENRFDYRLAVAYLAVALYKSYFTRKISEIPPILQTWKQICSSNDEFPQLRNVWIEKMNE